MKTMENILRIKSITEFRQILDLPAPEHPLISFHREGDNKDLLEIDDKFFGIRFTTDMYTIMYKDGVQGSLTYGRNSYDFQHGTLIFVAPSQVVTTPSKEMTQQSKGWSLIFHPDLIRKSSLGENIDDYAFFSYDVNEALHLSVKEENFIFEVVKQIEEEYSQNIDKHSQKLIVSNLELLLNYCTRFYDRQFYTRTNFNKDFVTKFEHKLRAYFNSDKPSELGIPTIQYFGKELNMSSRYLSDMLKKETGKSIKAHINEMIVDKARTVLLNSTLSVSEVAYDLGFEYPQSFTRLFKKSTGVSPLDYRNLN